MVGGGGGGGGGGWWGESCIIAKSVETCNCVHSSLFKTDIWAEIRLAKRVDPPQHTQLKPKVNLLTS